MGTSTSNLGQNGKTPLVPSWLDDDNGEENLIPSLGDPKRFVSPRNNFTRFINDKGRDTSNLHNAISQYIKNSLGGEKNATLRLGAAKNSTIKLVSIFNDFVNKGIFDTSQKYGLGELIGKSAKEVFLHIMDFVCPDGGSTDEGIARSSYIETLMTLPDMENRSIENLTDFEFLTFIKNYMANVVQERLINDIGNKAISLPDDIYEVEFIQSQINDYISGAISDSISILNMDIKNIDSTQTQNIVESVYEKAYNILASLEE